MPKTGSVRRERTERQPRDPPAAGPEAATLVDPMSRRPSERRPRDKAPVDSPAPVPLPATAPAEGPKATRIALAFAASFLLSFPVLLAIFHAARKDRTPEETPGTSSATGDAPGDDSLWDSPKREPVRPKGDPDPGHPNGSRPDVRVEEILARARDHASAKNYVEALSDLTYLLKNAGGDPRIRSEIERVEAARRVDVRAHLDEAARRLDRGDVGGARRKLEVVLWWNPGEREAETLLARIDRNGR